MSSKTISFQILVFDGWLKVSSLGADNFVFDMIAAFTQFPILILQLEEWAHCLACRSTCSVSIAWLLGVRVVGLSTVVGKSCMLLLAGVIKNFIGVFFFRVVGIFPLS